MHKKMNAQKDEMILFYKGLIDVIEKNIDKFEEIMKYVNGLPLSRGVLLYNFKRDFGYTIRNYYVARKLYIISEMIKHSDKSILDIALEFDYQHPSALNVAFKKSFGMTPLEYRKSDEKFENNYIKIEDMKMNNKVKEEFYDGIFTEWLKMVLYSNEISMKRHNVRLFKFDIENVKSPFELLSKRVIESLLKDVNTELQNRKITTTRLNKNEKLIFERYIFPQLSGTNQTVYLDTKVILQETRLSDECILTVVSNLTRHSVNIDADESFSYSKIFSNVKINGSNIEIRVSDLL